jgi:hypothetical protein
MVGILTDQTMSVAMAMSAQSLKVLAGFVGGLFFACLATLVYALLSAAASAAYQWAWAVFLVAYAVGLGLAIKAGTVGKAWRRLCALSGVLSLAAGAIIFAISYLARRAGSPPGPFFGGIGLTGGVSMIALLVIGMTLTAGAVFAGSQGRPHGRDAWDREPRDG